MEINFILKESNVDIKDVVKGLGVNISYDIDNPKSIEDAIQHHLKDLCLKAAELTKSVREKI